MLHIINVNKQQWIGSCGQNLNPLRMWLKVRFLIFVSGKNLVWKGEPNLSVPQVFVEIGHHSTVVETSYKYHGNQKWNMNNYF